jgi:hypothetical protein
MWHAPQRCHEKPRENSPRRLELACEKIHNHNSSATDRVKFPAWACEGALVAVKPGPDDTGGYAGGFTGDPHILHKFAKN